MKQELLKKRKSTFDVDNATNVISGIMFVAILLAVLLLVVAIIFGLSVFTTNGVNVSTIQANIVSMVSNFFALMPTVGTILAVVILIAAIVILVLYVRRMKDSGTSGGFQG
jgi:phosphate/sulfate permease